VAVREGLSAATRAGHVKILREFKEYVGRLSYRQRATRLPVALSTWLEEQRVERGWAWQTLVRNLASAAGAMSRLTEYTNAEANITLLYEKEWDDAMARAKTACNKQATTALPAVSAEAAKKMLDRAILAKRLTPQAATVLLLCWYTSGRPGDVLRLKKECIELTTEGGTAQVAVEFREHKTSRYRGPYVVQTLMPRRYLPFLQAQMAKRSRSEYLIPLTELADKRAVMTELRSFLQAENRLFDVRSLRRGTLQALGNDPENELEVVMAFSGHTRVGTTLGYTNQGRANRNFVGRMRNAACVLTPSGRHG
jgi:integrase